MIFTEQIGQLIDRGWNVTQIDSYAWKLRVANFLRSAGRVDAANEFQKLSLSEDTWTLAKQATIGFLEGLLALETEKASAPSQNISSTTPSAPRMHSKRVFIVHGHDIEAKEKVARFLERLELEPIILHEQPNSGQTVIEKFEAHSEVGFAVVLLTPDDVGALAEDQANLAKRARQNVILELGYFVGKLSRRRVCALYKEGVELPSDFQGVLYVKFDVPGAWRTKLAQELVEAGFSIKLEALIKS